MKIFPTFLLTLALSSQAYGVTFEVMNEDAPRSIYFLPPGGRGNPDLRNNLKNFNVSAVCGDCIDTSTAQGSLIKKLPFEKIKKINLPKKRKTSNSVPVYSIEGEEIQSLTDPILTILMSWDLNYAKYNGAPETLLFVIALPFENKEFKGKNKITLKIQDIKRIDFPEPTKYSKYVEYDNPPLDFKLTLLADDQFITYGVYKFLSYGQPTVYKEFKSEEKLDSKSEKVIDPKSEGEVS